MGELIQFPKKDAPVDVELPPELLRRCGRAAANAGVKLEKFVVWALEEACYGIDDDVA